MRLLRRLLVFCICILAFYFLVIESEITQDLLKKNISGQLNQSKISLERKTLNNQQGAIDQANLIPWIDQNASKLIQEFGEPERKDLSAYGYTWWIYPQLNHYTQFGISDDDKIETVYTRGIDVPIKDLKNKKTYHEINQSLMFDKQVKYRGGLSSYTFFLTDEDLLQRPLAHIIDDIFVQFYFDQFTNDLSSFRILKADTLLKHVPYEIQYRGNLPESPSLTEEEWEEINRGMEQQIFDLTNVVRTEFKLEKVKWKNDVHEVALMHSKDMANNHYFSHVGLEGEGLKERLDAKDVFYQSAGENIAAQYPDGPAAIEGWLNSEGHRKALLDEGYTHLGVGAHRLHYTQNFITHP